MVSAGLPYMILFLQQSITAAADWITRDGLVPEVSQCQTLYGFGPSSQKQIIK